MRLHRVPEAARPYVFHPPSPLCELLLNLVSVDSVLMSLSGWFCKETLMLL